MGYEIDFLPVGTKSKSGDAIALRIGDLHEGEREDQFVAIVDGGFTASGHKLVEHVKEHYGTEKLDLVIATHLDQDHIRGLSVVIDELEVTELWMHEPTAEEVEDLEKALIHSTGSLRARLGVVTASIQESQGLATQARQLGIKIVHPFTGLETAGGAIQVIGPTQEYYESLVPKFRDYVQTQTYSSMIAHGLEQKTGSPLRERLDHELLEEGATTGPENSSSVVTLIQVGDRSIILTGDAGAEAMGHAADYLEGVGFDWGTLRAMQIPHHGSKNNVTPSILNRYLGEPVQFERKKQAYVSCSTGGGVHHPSKRVTNAFHRRGCRVYKTAGRTKRLFYDAPERVGFSPATEVPFYGTVD